MLQVIFYINIFFWIYLYIQSIYFFICKISCNTNYICNDDILTSLQQTQHLLTIALYSSLNVPPPRYGLGLKCPPKSHVFRGGPFRRWLDHVGTALISELITGGSLGMCLWKMSPSGTFSLSLFASDCLHKGIFPPSTLLPCCFFQVTVD